MHRNSTLAYAKALKLCAAAQGFTPSTGIRRLRHRACPGAAWIGARAGSRQDYAVPNGRTFMRQPTRTVVTHGSIDRRLGGKSCSFMSFSCTSVLPHRQCTPTAWSPGTGTCRSHPLACFHPFATGERKDGAPGSSYYLLFVLTCSGRKSATTSLTKNRNPSPTITRTKNFATQHRSPQFRRVWASLARADPICETLTAIDRYPACTRCLYHRHYVR